MCEKLFTTDSKVGKSERAIPMGVWGEINDCVWETVSTWDKQKPNQARWNARITFISLSFSFVVYSFLYLKPHIWMLSTHPTKSHWQHQNYEVYLSVYYFCALVIISRLILCVLLWCVNLFFFLRSLLQLWLFSSCTLISWTTIFIIVLVVFTRTRQNHWWYDNSDGDEQARANVRRNVKRISYRKKYLYMNKEAKKKEFAETATTVLALPKQWECAIRAHAIITILSTNKIQAICVLAACITWGFEFNTFYLLCVCCGCCCRWLPLFSLCLSFYVADCLLACRSSCIHFDETLFARSQFVCKYTNCERTRARCLWAQCVSVLKQQT